MSVCTLRALLLQATLQVADFSTPCIVFLVVEHQPVGSYRETALTQIDSNALFILQRYFRHLERQRQEEPIITLEYQWVVYRVRSEHLFQLRVLDDVGIDPLSWFGRAQ